MNKLIIDPRTTMDRVFNALVQAELDAGRAVSRHEVAEALAATGCRVRSLDGFVWRLEIANRIWRSGMGNHGKNGRHCQLYTVEPSFTPASRRPILPGRSVPPEVRRAVRDLASALRGAAEALTRLDDVADGPR